MFNSSEFLEEHLMLCSMLNKIEKRERLIEEKKHYLIFGIFKIFGKSWVMI